MVFYEMYRKQYSWMPPRVIKCAYRDAVRRVKIVYSDDQDWGLENEYNA
jgi:uncharacterized protein YndB with AHSA1/START domain